MKKKIRSLTEFSKLLAETIYYTNLYYEDNIIDIEVIRNWRLSSILNAIKFGQLEYEYE